jgi:peptide chain release factor subunit 1
MFDEQELRDLASYSDEENLICSFYYPLEKGDPTEQGALIRLRNMIGEATADTECWTSAQARSVSDDLERIESLVMEELVVAGGGLGVFACAPADLWRVFHLPDKIGPLLVVEHTTYMRPLIEFMARYERYCTVLVGKGRARIFLLDAGGVEERADVFGEVPGRHDQGGWAQARYQRHHDDKVMRHLKETAEQTFSILQKEEFDRLFIGGTEELVSEFLEYLHPYLKGKLAMSFPMEMSSTAPQVREQTLAEAGAILDAREEETIDKLRAEVHSGNLGAAGLEDTIQALQKGQVLTLIVSEDLEASGYRCTSCGQLSLNSPCPFCGGESELVADILEEVVKQSFLQNSEIIFVGSGNKEELDELGGVGALLRFAG